jgi:hypothetical protein
MHSSVTSLLRDKLPPFQQACFRCILQFQLISLLNRKLGEKKDDGIGDPFKIFIEEALTQQRNEMMDSFMQILRRLPTDDISSSNGGAAPFKV